MLDFVKTDVFPLEVSVGALSAVPRWRFARVLEAKGEDSSSPRLHDALLAMYKSTCEIGRGCNVLKEHISNKETDAGAYRLSLYGAIMRSYLYMAEKNSSLLWVRLIWNEAYYFSLSE